MGGTLIGFLLFNFSSVHPAVMMMVGIRLPPAPAWFREVQSTPGGKKLTKQVGKECLGRYRTGIALEAGNSVCPSLDSWICNGTMMSLYQLSVCVVGGQAPQEGLDQHTGPPRP